MPRLKLPLISTWEEMKDKHRWNCLLNHDAIRKEHEEKSFGGSWRLHPRVIFEDNLIA